MTNTEPTLGGGTSTALLKFMALCGGVWLYAADTLVTATVAPALVLDIGGIAFVNWTISVYEIGGIVAGAAAAALAQRLGIKRLFVSAALAYATGCAAAALASNVAILLGGRLAQGLGGGMLLSLCYLATHRWFAEHLWNRLFGIVAFIWGAGSLVGPLIGGYFSEHHDWRGAFWSFALQAGVLALTAIVFLPADLPTRFVHGAWPGRPLWLLSAATFVIAAAGVAAGPASAAAGCLAGGGLLYLAARADRRASVRLLPAQLLDLRHPIGAGLIMVFTLSAATTGFWTYGPLLLKLLFGVDSRVSGYILAAEALAWSLATLAISGARDAWEIPLIRGGTCIVAAGAAGFALVVPSGWLWGTVLCAVLEGAGFGLCWPAIVHRMLRLADPSEQTLAASAAPTIQRIGYAVGTAAAGVAAGFSGLSEGVPASSVKGAAFWVFAAFIPALIIGLLGAWRFTAASAATNRRPAPVRARTPAA